MLLACSRRSYCRTPGRTRHADGLLGRCASVPIPKRSSPLATTLPRKPGTSARHARYVASAETTGDQAAATVRAASTELADPFGPDGSVQAWIERVETPWDLSAGDAILGRYLAAAAGGREDVELATEFAKDLPELMSGKFAEFAGPWMAGLSRGEATEAELASALREFTGDYQAIGGLNAAWKAGGKAAAALGRPLGALAIGADLVRTSSMTPYSHLSGATPQRRRVPNAIRLPPFMPPGRELLRARRIQRGRPG